MSRDWESVFGTWGAPPSVTETEKMENAERAVKKAIAASDALRSRDVRVFAQGSYRNRTNVRQESDVDICVLCTDSFYFQLPQAANQVDFGLITPAVYRAAEFRRDVEDALVSHLGRGGVTTGSKAFDIHENTYRVDADVVACFEYRYYYENRSYRTGTALLPREGNYIINYPEQNYENGRRKNDDTNRRFRAGVRILKNLCNEMCENRISAAREVQSYLLECLAWNVPNQGFDRGSNLADVRWILAHLFNNTLEDTKCQEWGEVNEFKYLFRPAQPWTRIGAHAFLRAAWDYVGFE